MRTSERLDKIVDLIRPALQELRRLEVDLPDGATLEITEAQEVRLERVIFSLQFESVQLRRFHD